MSNIVEKIMKEMNTLNIEMNNGATLLVTLEDLDISEVGDWVVRIYAEGSVLDVKFYDNKSNTVDVLIDIDETLCWDEWGDNIEDAIMNFVNHAFDRKGYEDNRYTHVVLVESPVMFAQEYMIIRR